MKTRLAVIAVLALAFSQGRAYAEVMCPGANQVEQALCKDMKASRQRAESIPQVPAPPPSPAVPAASSGLCASYTSLARQYCEQKLAETGVAGIPGCTESFHAVNFCILALRLPEVRAAGMSEAKFVSWSLEDDDYDGFVKLGNRRVLWLVNLRYETGERAIEYR